MQIRFANSFLAQKIPYRVIRPTYIQIILGIAFFSVAFFLLGVQNVNAEPNVTVEILDVSPQEKEGNWGVQWHVCTEKELHNPWFRLSSDVEFFTVGAEVMLPKGNCNDFSYQIEAEDPKSLEVSYIEKNPTDKTIILVAAEKGKFLDKFLLRFRICAGDNPVVNPQIIAKSDIDYQRFSFFSNIGPGSCLYHDLNLRAKELNTITIDYGDQLTAETKKFERENNLQNISHVPVWIKNNAKWWSEGKVSDSDFTSGIQYLINEGLMVISKLPKTSQYLGEQVPEWVRNTAGWWADGLLSEDDFVKGIQYLVEQGIIRV